MISDMLESDVYTVRVKDGQVEAVLPPALNEAIEKGAEGFFDRILTNPSAPDMIFALMAAVLGGAGVIKTRDTLRKKTAAKKATEAKTPE